MEPVVKIQEGQIKGFVDKDINGVDFYSFLGIPYAEPPVGNLRFKAPVPKKPWSGILDTITEPPCEYCEQISPPTDENPAPHLRVFGSEDCLYLNVYTKELPKTGKEPLKPVMVFIHGGGFTTGSATRDLYGGGALVSEDVVLVTIQYRLGTFGFLALNDVKLGVTGNAGLKDAVLALKWIQNNIKSFQGDPKNVTIFGESAGGAAVHYLLLSPLTKGLFHKVIAQSGTSLATWARGQNPNGHLLAEAMGCKDKDETKILEFLQKLSTDQVYKGQQKLKDMSYADTPRLFCPVIEKPSPAAFITEEPLKILSSGNYNKVPLMIGYTSKEGLLFVFMEKLLASMEMSPIKKNVPFDLGLSIDSPQYTEVHEKIKKFYNLKNIDPDNRTAKEVIDAGTDLFFLKDISLAARLHSIAQSEPVYFYKVTADTQLNYLKVFTQIKIEGTCHGDDLGYLFTNALPIAVAPGSEEDIIRKRFLKLWTQFARTGNPNIKEKDLIPVEWKPIQNGQFNYFEIGSNPTVGVNPDDERVKFWDNIYKSNAATASYLKNLNF